MEGGGMGFKFLFFWGGAGLKDLVEFVKYWKTPR